MRITPVIAIIVPSALLGACAAGTANTPHGIQTPDVVTDHARLTPVAPGLPDADRQLVEIREDAGDVASAQVKLCVNPAGRVDSVNILHRSWSPAYDNALLSDVPQWRFTGGPLAFAQSDTCEDTTIIYRAPE